MHGRTCPCWRQQLRIRGKPCPCACATSKACTEQGSDQAAAPTADQIPASDLIGVTVILLTAAYREKEFVRIGYYVNTEYDTEELRSLEEDKRPDPPLLDKLQRTVLADKPRVTRFNITWEAEAA